MLEKAQQRKVGVLQVTIHLGTPRVSISTVFASIIIPLVIEAIPILVLGNAIAFVLQIDVLRK